MGGCKSVLLLLFLFVSLQNSLRSWATITNPGQQQQQQRQRQQQQQQQQHQQHQQLSLTRIRALREYVLNISRSQQLNDDESSSSQEAEAEPSAAGLVSTQRSVFEQTVCWYVLTNFMGKSETEKCKQGPCFGKSFLPLLLFFFWQNCWMK